MFAQIEWDRAGTILAWSTRCEELLGWRAADAVGATLAGLGLVDAAGEVILRDAGSFERLGQVSLPVRSKQGGVVTCSWFIAPANAERAVAVLEPVPGPLPAGSLYRRAYRLHHLFERAPNAFVVFDPFGRFRYGNVAAEELYGTTRRSMLGHTFSPFIERSDREKVERLFKIAAGGDSMEFETTLIRGDGAHVEINVVLFPVHVDGRVIGVCAILGDLSLLRMTERRLMASQQRFRSLFEYHPDPVLLVDRSGFTQNANVATTQMTGYELEEIVMRPLGTVLEADAAHGGMPVQEMLLHHASELDMRLRRKDGSGVEVRVNSVPVLIDDELSGTFLIAKDMTAQKRAERELHNQSERLRSLYLVAASAGRSSQQQIVDTLELGVRLFDMGFALLGQVEGDDFVLQYTAGNMLKAKVGTHVSVSTSKVRSVLERNDVVALSKIDPDPFPESPERDSVSQSYIAAPIDVFGRRYGAIAFYGKTPHPFSAQDEDLIRLMGALCASALERSAHEERLDSLAFFDALTGLPNRVLLDERISQMLALAERRKRRFAVMYVDVDFFKEVNDMHGHAVGDAVLKVVAARLQQAVRKSDTVARLGGDEFIVLQSLNRASDARKLAERIAVSLRAPIELPSVRLSVSASLGIAFFPDDGATSVSLLGNADEALYRAKAAGRDRVEFFTRVPEDDVALSEGDDDIPHAPS